MVQTLAELCEDVDRIRLYQKNKERGEKYLAKVDELFSRGIDYECDSCECASCDCASCNVCDCVGY